MMTGIGENANKRKIILNALQQVAADYSTGSTARRICQELKLIGDPRNPYDAKLTKKGRRVMYHWNKAISEYTKLDHIVHVHEKVEAVDVEETSVFELHSKIDMDIEDVYGRELTGAESILIGTCLRILKQQGHLRAKLPKIEGLTQQLIESKRYGDRYDVGRAIMQAAQAYNDMSEE